MATYHSEVDELAVETLGDWHKPLNRVNEVGNGCHQCKCCDDADECAVLSAAMLWRRWGDAPI